MMRIPILLCVLVLSVVAIKPHSHETEPMRIMREILERTQSQSSMFTWFNDFISNTKKLVQQHFPSVTSTKSEWKCDTSNPRKHCTLVPDEYYRFIPVYLLDVPLDGTKKTWEGFCFKTNVGHVEKHGLSHKLVVESSGASGKCKDAYMLGNMEWIDIVKPASNGSAQGLHQWHYDVPISTSIAHDEWFKRNGVRVLQFLDPENDDGIRELLATVELFLGDATATLTQKEQDLFMKFSRDYLHVTYPPRNGTVLHLPENTVKDGTLLAVGRADGLTGFQSWGEGAISGHITMAMRFNNTLHVVESTDHTSYWPPHHIQMHTWDKWLEMAYNANFSVMLFPLNDTNQRIFDANIDKARKFVMKNLGGPYGYHNYLFGWMDEGNDNLPFPATFELLEIVLSIFGELAKPVATRMWLEALNIRMTGTWSSNHSLVEISNWGHSKGMTFADVWNIPEQDAWRYSDGPSMVCDVFACSLYKVTGIFGELTNDIQCTEFQTGDIYAIDIYDTTMARPAACHQEDPTLKYGWCQIEGEWGLKVRHAGNVPLYSHMFEKCGGHCPNFTRAPHC